MKVKELRTNFINKLAPIYGEEESISFFNLLCDFNFRWTRLEVTLNLETDLLKEQLDFFDSVTPRLLNYEPIQYILGETEFMDTIFKVTPDTLIPRPETEELVRWMVSECKDLKTKIKLLDIGTGSGCIAISVGKVVERAEITAIDVSEGALEVAKLNAKSANVDVEFLQKNILAAKSLPGMYDIIVSNPPYVRVSEKAQMNRNVLDHEPELALYVSNQNPLIFYRKIAELARFHLKSGGLLFFEINQYLSKELIEMLEQKDFTDVMLKEDIYGNPRMIKCNLHEKS